jgi:hypothetical protein
MCWSLVQWWQTSSHWKVTLILHLRTMMWPIFHASLTFWNVMFTNVFPNVFSSPGQRPCELLASVVRRKLSHFNLLLRNHWANYNQTLVEWSLDGPLPKLFPVIPTSNQDGCQAKNRKKGGWNFNCPLLL